MCVRVCVFVCVCVRVCVFVFDIASLWQTPTVNLARSCQRNAMLASIHRLWFFLAGRGQIQGGPGLLEEPYKKQTNKWRLHKGKVAGDIPGRQKTILG